MSENKPTDTAVPPGVTAALVLADGTVFWGHGLGAAIAFGLPVIPKEYEPVLVAGIDFVGGLRVGKDGLAGRFTRCCIVCVVMPLNIRQPFGG